MPEGSLCQGNISAWQCVFEGEGGHTTLEDNSAWLEHLHDPAHDRLEELQVHGVRDAFLQERSQTATSAVRAHTQLEGRGARSEVPVSGRWGRWGRWAGNSWFEEM